MITFESVTINDFLSHGNTELKLANRGLVLVKGGNGAGKSTLLVESLTWCLFGQTAREGLKGDQVIRTGASSCGVTLRGTKDSTPFVVARARGPATLRFEVGSSDVTGASIKETELAIEQFLGLDIKTFLATVLFPQGAAGLASMSAAEQRAILGQVLDLNRFEDAFERLKGLKNTLNAELAETSAKLSTTEAQIASEEGHLVRLKAAKASFEEEKSRTVSHYLKELKAKKKAKVDPQKVAEWRQLEGMDLYQANHKILAEQAIFDRKTQKALAQVAANRAQHLTTLKLLKEPEECLGECQTCGQHLPDEVVSQLKEKHVQALREYESTKVKHEQALEELDEAERAHRAAQAMHDQRISDNLLEVKTLLQRLSQLREETKACRDYEAEVEALTAKVEYEKARSWSGDSAIEATEHTLTLLKAQLPNLQETVGDLTQELSYVDFWHEGFGTTGVRHYYLATLTPFLSERADYYLKQLTDGKGSISLTTQKETKKGTFTDTLDIQADLGQGTLYAAKSGGEKRRISVALLFALAELMATRARVKANLLVVDEVFDSVDAEGTSMILNLLKDLSGFKESIFVISHNPDLQGEFENVITVENVGGVSRVHEA